MPYLAKCVASRGNAANVLLLSYIKKWTQQRTLQNMCASVMSRGAFRGDFVALFLAMR